MRIYQPKSTIKIIVIQNNNKNHENYPTGWIRPPRMIIYVETYEQMS